ncbi:MAG: hypothetical protein HY825_04540 [Acidobacteria bacterium]|nr:hypothetical protein [Acidobacteriota bacterium]
MGYRIEVEGLPPFDVARDGGVVTCDAAPGVARSQPFTEAVLGPALTVALALKGTFCFHASALRRGDRVVAFAGESGAGKSTLAREIDLATNGRWARVSDDALPVMVQDGNIEVDVRFPQLKLDASEQSTPDRRGRFPLAAFVIVEPSPPAAGGHLEQAGPAESLLAVASHTVAARLFDRELLGSHLAFSRDVARLVPVFRLTYPHRPSAIAEVVAILDRLVGPDHHRGARV